MDLWYVLYYLLNKEMVRNSSPFDLGFDFFFLQVLMTFDVSGDIISPDLIGKGHFQ